MRSPTVQNIVQHPISKFILTFLALHTIIWLAIVAHSQLCVDMSLMGYFRNMINGHGPVCHGLITVAYHASNNIYVLISGALVTSGISWIINRISPDN